MSDIRSQIDALRAELGSSLVIMGHHYQSDEVIRHTDFRGDSLELARRVPDIDAPHIIFCGVYFMGESAALLARPGQNVYLPAMDADCVMSLMAPPALVKNVLEKLNAGSRKVLPLAYVNTSLAVKAVVGQFGGAVCTSANAANMLDWARKQADTVLFLPDKNLGINTARQLGMNPDAIKTLNIRTGAKSVDARTADNAEMLLWPGCCAIHARFTVAQINALRARHPGITVAVHPECPPDVVAAADMAGSTSALIRLVESAKDGATIAIGTETNLVRRLAAEHGQRLTILPLEVSICSNMAKVTEERLLACLQAIKNGTAQALALDDAMREPARLSLTRMLEAIR